MQIRHAIKHEQAILLGHLKESPFSHRVFAFFVDSTKCYMICPINTQMHTMSQPKLKVLKDLNRDKCVTDWFFFILMHISAFGCCLGFCEFIIESWKKKHYSLLSFAAMILNNLMHKMKGCYPAGKHSGGKNYRLSVVNLNGAVCLLELFSLYFLFLW